MSINISNEISLNQKCVFKIFVSTIHIHIIQNVLKFNLYTYIQIYIYIYILYIFILYIHSGKMSWQYLDLIFF